MRRGKQAGSRRENGFPSGVMHLCFPERNTESPLPPVSLSLLFFPKRVSLPFSLFLPLPSSTGYIRSRMGKAIESILSASNRLFDQPSWKPAFLRFPFTILPSSFLSLFSVRRRGFSSRREKERETYLDA